MSKLANLPRSMKALTALTGLGAVINFFSGIWLIMDPSNTQLGVNGSLPQWFVLISGLLCLVMALVYVWIISQILKRAATTQILVQVISVINISFAIFRMPFGLIAITVNLAGLALVSGSNAKIWFSKDS